MTDAAITIGGVAVDPDMRALLAAKQAASSGQLGGDARSSWNGYAAAMQRPYPAGMTVGDSTIEAEGADGGRRIAVRVYRPAGLPASAPCVVYIHGGAFIKGSLDSGDPIAWGVASQVRCIVLSLDYRLAPENPFPAGVEDCYATLRHLSRHGQLLGIAPERIALWGDSAGGNMAAATCLMARDRSGPAIAAQVLVYPCLTDDLSAPSYTTFADAPVTTASIDRAWSLYLGTRRPTRDPYATPLKAPDLGGLPPAFVHMAEIDCLADDSRAYVERLAQSGSPATLRVARGMIHGFLRARFSGPRAAAEFDAPCAFLRGILGQP